MARRPTQHLLGAAAALVLLLAPAGARAQLAQTPPELQEVDVREHLNAHVPGDAVFRDQDGRMVRLGQYFDRRRPVVLNLVYHRCSMLCSLVLNALVNGLRGTQWTAGEQFQVVTISIDPRDTPQVAADKRHRVLQAYNRAPAQRGWHFLVGDETNIRRVANAVGWTYRYDPRQNEYAHPAAVMLLTPDGKIARYLYGIQYDPNDLRFGLLEASQGRSITTVERILLWCYHYDPQGRRYVLVARRIMQAGGVVTVALLGGLLLVLWRRDRRRSKSTGSPPGPTPGAGPTHDPDVPLTPAAQDLRGQGY